MNFTKQKVKRGLCFFLSIQLLFTTSATTVDSAMPFAAEDDEFSIAIIPDTQYYTSEKHGGKKEMFDSQTEWIVKNATKEKIAYVIHLGDISDDGEKFPQQWVNAAKSMYILEKAQSGYPQGIPYGMAVGNHDQTKSQYPLTGKTEQYNRYFGIDHFKGKKWYGGHYRNDNDSHFDFFEAGGLKFITIFFEYDSYDEDVEPLNKWASMLLEKYADRKAILVSHSITHHNITAGTNEKAFPKFSRQGQRIFDRLKSYPNVMFTLSGHVGNHGEGYRQDGYAGNVIKSFLTDYQSRPDGGHGLMRLMTFSKSKDLIKCRTFSPFTGEEEKDKDSDFTLPWMHHTTVARYLDFDNDQVTDLSYYAKGNWKIGNKQEVAFGAEGDIPVPADYDGDGKVEMAVFRPTQGKFLIKDRKEVLLGKAGDIPVCGDWDGDGFADVAVYRPSTLTWYFDGLDSVVFGNKKAIPVPADYDGDGKLDVGFFRTDNSLWQTALGNIPLQLPHVAGDIPIPGDYNGDGKAEMALYRPSTSEWLIDFMPLFKFGQQGDIPLPGNYLKDGKTYPAVYRDGKILLQNQMTISVSQAEIANLVNIPYGVKAVLFNKAK